MAGGRAQCPGARPRARRPPGAADRAAAWRPGIEAHAGSVGEAQAEKGSPNTSSRAAGRPPVPSAWNSVYASSPPPPCPPPGCGEGLALALNRADQANRRRRRRVRGVLDERRGRRRAFGSRGAGGARGCRRGRPASRAPALRSPPTVTAMPGSPRPANIPPRVRPMTASPVYPGEPLPASPRAVGEDLLNRARRRARTSGPSSEACREGSGAGEGTSAPAAKSGASSIGAKRQPVDGVSRRGNRRAESDNIILAATSASARAAEEREHQGQRQQAARHGSAPADRAAGGGGRIRGGCVDGRPRIDGRGAGGFGGIHAALAGRGHLERVLGYRWPGARRRGSR